jgi:hypothetical protein
MALPKRFISFIVFFIIAIGFSVLFLLYFSHSSRAFESSARTAQTVFTIASPQDIVNQDGDLYTTGSTQIEGTDQSAGTESWLGTGESKADSYLGLFFTGGSIPHDAIIESAHIELTSSRDQWLYISSRVGVERSVSPVSFSQANPPAKRNTTAFTTLSNNIKWSRDQSNFDTSIDVTRQIMTIQKLSRTGDTRKIAFVIKGTGERNDRKYIYNAGIGAPRLIINYIQPSP